MKNRSHNKKRNVGIIYEQLINYMCKCIIDNDENGVSKINSVIKENFKKDTQLYRELKFFNALIQTKGIDASLATNIIQEAKKSCQHHFSEDVLEKEKSSLIKELNYSFGKGNLFESKVKNYKMLATVQTLLNEWRKGKNSDFQIITQYEKQLHDWMTESINESTELNESYVSKNVDELTFRIMNQKFNKKYDKLLNDDQKKLIKLFVENKSNTNIDLTNLFDEIKLKSIKLLESFNCNNQILNERYDIVKNNVKAINIRDISEENLKKFLTLCKLNEELKGDINE
jgi:hypothetical protein